MKYNIGDLIEIYSTENCNTTSEEGIIIKTKKPDLYKVRFISNSSEEWVNESNIKLIKKYEYKIGDKVRLLELYAKQDSHKVLEYATEGEIFEIIKIKDDKLKLKLVNGKKYVWVFATDVEPYIPNNSVNHLKNQILRVTRRRVKEMNSNTNIKKTKFNIDERVWFLSENEIPKYGIIQSVLQDNNSILYKIQLEDGTHTAIYEDKLHKVKFNVGDRVIFKDFVKNINKVGTIADIHEGKYLVKISEKEYTNKTKNDLKFATNSDEVKEATKEFRKLLDTDFFEKGSMHDIPKAPDEEVKLKEDTKYQEGFNKGRDLTWIAVQSLVKASKTTNLEGTLQDVLLHSTAEEILSKLSNNQLIFNIGDEIINKNNEKSVIVYITKSGSLYCLYPNGDVPIVINPFKAEIKKTGKTYPQVVEMLKELQE